MANQNHDGNYSFNSTTPQTQQNHQDPFQQTASEVRRVLEPLMTPEQRRQVDQNAPCSRYPGVSDNRYLEYPIYEFAIQNQKDKILRFGDLGPVYHVHSLLCKLSILVCRDRRPHDLLGLPKSHEQTIYERDFPSVLLYSNASSNDTAFPAQTQTQTQPQLSAMYENEISTVAPTIADPSSMEELVAVTDRLTIPGTFGQTTSDSNSGHEPSFKTQHTRSNLQLNRSTALPPAQNNSTLLASTAYHQRSSPGPTNSPHNVTTDYNRTPRRQKTQKDATRRRSWLQWHGNDAESLHGAGQATRTRSSAPKANNTGVTSLAQPAYADTGISNFLEPDELRLWYDPTVDRDLLKRLLRLRLDTDAVRSIIRRRVPNPDEAPLRAYMQRITQSARWDNLAND